MSYGPYPLISLKEARDKRDRDKKLLLEGIDPASVKKERKLAAEIAARGRFEVLAEELLDKNRREGKAEQTIKKKSSLNSKAHQMGPQSMWMVSFFVLPPTVQLLGVLSSHHYTVSGCEKSSLQQ